MDSKTCPKCFKDKPFSQYHSRRDRYGKKILASACKECENARQRSKYRRKKAEKAAKKTVRRLCGGCRSLKRVPENRLLCGDCRDDINRLISELPDFRGVSRR